MMSDANQFAQIMEGVGEEQTTEITEGTDEMAVIQGTTADHRYLATLHQDSKLKLSTSGGQDPVETAPTAERVFVEATEYAGVIGLPSGRQLTIHPKLRGTPLLRLLQLSQTEATTKEFEARVEAGTEFVELLAELYCDELERVLQRGVERAYQSKTADEKTIRGRLNLHRQLQRKGPAAPTFDCTYDELTRDTLLNQTVLRAGWLLHRAVTAPQLRRRLHRHVTGLQRDVTLRTISRQEVDSISLDRLNEYYSDLLRLSMLVIGETLIEEMAPGPSAAYTVLINMRHRYEDVVETSVANAVAASYPNLHITNTRVLRRFLTGDFAHEPEADIRLKDQESEKTVLILDAKWKSYTEKPKRKDLYQMISYQQYEQAPAVLIYPGSKQDAGIVSHVSVTNGYPLYVAILPVEDEYASFEAYRNQLTAVTSTVIGSTLPNDNT